MDLRTIPVPGVQMKAIPVNPSDPIAIINGQAITRQQLADECVAKEGKKVLDVMINRLLIEQALRRQNKTVTAAEIDEEIDAIAQRFGISREGWLRTLDKERGISPAQYAREIVYPAIALRKLCSDRVTVHAEGPEGRVRVAVRREAAGPDDPRQQADQGDADLGRAARQPRRLRGRGQGEVDGPRQQVARGPAGRADHPARLSRGP